MAIFKCKMCGAPLKIQNGQNIVKCDYCGVIQTLPKLDSDKKIYLYDRANHFRRENDYDNALSIYEKILEEDNTDSEAYWSLVLCKYGIEYVDDTHNNKRIPTVNRMQIKSILNDEDYLKALEYADDEQKKIYISEAQEIDKIQKSILAISQKEEPFDIFICYKETDENGNRTKDSVIAQEIYYELIRCGFKVFFSRISLEDKLGIQYEPYIFAALNSAKIMIAVGTSAENFNSVWVKNEWGRYLKMVETNHDKHIIPVYKDMNPYDIPKELSMLQAQDMNKLGSMQDLIRGINKLVGKNDVINITNENNIAADINQVNITNLLKRIKLFLSDKDFDSAKEYIEKVLDLDPVNSEAYMSKVLCKNSVSSIKELKDKLIDISEDKDFIKALKFALPQQKEFYDELYNESKVSKEKNKEIIYQEAFNHMKKADIKGGNNAISEYRTAIYMLDVESMRNYKQSFDIINYCQQRIDKIKKLYNNVSESQMKQSHDERVRENNKKLSTSIVLSVFVIIMIITILCLLITL